jgi:hypothetical protein
MKWVNVEVKYGKCTVSFGVKMNDQWTQLKVKGTQGFEGDRKELRHFEERPTMV